MNHIHRFLPSPSGSARTLLVLHGTGGDEDSLVPFAQAVDPEAAILSPRGNVKEGTANRFFRRLAEGVFDIEDLLHRTYELADFVEEASKEYGLDRGHMVALGYSNGANIAGSLLLLRPDVISGGILLRAMVPLEPPEPANLIGKNVLILTGERDPIVPADNAGALATMLRACGANVTQELMSAGHDLTRRDLEASQAWLQASDQA